jgi:acyl-CoA dehydrogenase
MFISREDNDPLRVLEDALAATEEAEPIEHRMHEARKDGTLASGPYNHDVEIAAAIGLITKAEAIVVEKARRLRRQAIMVDDFPKDLRRTEIYQTTQAVG